MLHQSFILQMLNTLAEQTITDQIQKIADLFGVIFSELDVFL